MKSANFEFLRAKWPALASLAGFAEHYCHPDPESSLIKLRLLIEQIVEHIYSVHQLAKPYQATLHDLLNDRVFQQSTPQVVVSKLHTVRITGNKAAHGGKATGQIALSDRSEMLADALRALPERTQIVLRDVGRNITLQPQDVGVGLSQIVPVIVALLDPGGQLVALEQPELHLHPRQQAALGDALIKGLQTVPDRVLIVETHSEHLILRLLRRIRETTRKQVVKGQALRPDQLRIQYVRREGSVSRAQTIDVDVNGDLVDPWPDDFFEQDFKERFS